MRVHDVRSGLEGNAEVNRLAVADAALDAAAAVGRGADFAAAQPERVVVLPACEQNAAEAEPISKALDAGRLARVVLTPLGFAAGQFRFSVSGPVGPDYVLQRSANLNNWINLFTITPTSLPFTITDTNTTTFSNQFYRAPVNP